MKLWFFASRDMKLFDGRKMTRKPIKFDDVKIWDRPQMSSNIMTAIRYARGEILCLADVEIDHVASYGDRCSPLVSKLIEKKDAAKPLKRYFDLCTSLMPDPHQRDCVSKYPYSDWFSMEDVSLAEYRLVLPNRLSESQKSEVESWIMNESIPMK